LTKVSEKIDGLHILPGSNALHGSGCQHYLLISTFGVGKVPAFGGGNIKFRGEDVLGFCLTNSGSSTAGTWTKVLDGSDEGMNKNSMFSLSGNEDGSVLYLTTKSTFNVDAASGGHSMVYKYDFGTGEFTGPHFSAPANGLNEKVNGLHVVGDLP